MLIFIFSQENSRDAKQLVVRPSSPGQYGDGLPPPRRLLLPGNGNENIKNKLQNGPLTLHNGRLKPVATIERVDKDMELDFESDQRSKQTNRNFPIRSFGGPVRKLNPRRPGIRRNTGGPTFFPQDNVPFSYNSKPVPEVYLTDFSDSSDFEQFSSDQQQE